MQPLARDAAISYRENVVLESAATFLREALPDPGLAEVCIKAMMDAALAHTGNQPISKT